MLSCRFFRQRGFLRQISDRAGSSPEFQFLFPISAQPRPGPGDQHQALGLTTLCASAGGADKNWQGRGQV